MAKLIAAESLITALKDFVENYSIDADTAGEICDWLDVEHEVDREATITVQASVSLSGSVFTHPDDDALADIVNLEVDGFDCEVQDISID